MIKRSIQLVIAAAVLASFTACASPYRALITNVTLPSPHLQYPMDAQRMLKQGSASCTGFLGIVASGDASVGAAMKNGGITKIHHVDFENSSFLGLFAKHTTIVYGE